MGNGGSLPDSKEASPSKLSGYDIRKTPGDIKIRDE